MFLDCEHDTDEQMSMLLPMLLMNENSTSDSLMTMMLMQSMGNNPVELGQMMPFLMMDDKEDEDVLLMMVVMNSMTGEINSPQGFDNNFNMLLPLLLDGDESKQKNLLVMMMAMQSQAPNTKMGPNKMLPLLLMDDESSNENLIFYIMMSHNKLASCEPVQPVISVQTEKTTLRDESNEA